MNTAWRKIVQAIFFFFFLFLFFTGKIQIWMVIFLGNAFLALFLGRFYCGWICPINTMMQVITKTKKIIGSKNLSIPAFIKKPLTRCLILAIFIVAFLFIKISGKQLPLLPLLFISGAILTLFFSETLWHRYLCPFGTILTLISRKPRHYLKIDSPNCLQCGLCAQICPGEAIKKEPTFQIDKELCLQCLNCSQHCPKDAIHF
ncbi:MAG: 4Fe-4S binding protein [Peptococcia bacterium]|jgi:ferredoxin-type protein NapH